MAGIVARNTSMLASWPEIGRPGSVPNTRELAIVGTPFVAIYRLIGKRVEIMRLLHGAQKWP
jgi:toxin ParE1/3/4